MSEIVTLLIGTTKGVFLLSAGGARRDWALSGPHCGGWPINHVLGDAATGRLWAAGGGDFHGAGVWRSEDGGRHWTLAKLANGQFDAWLTESPELAAELGVRPDPPAPYSGQIAALWVLGLAGDTLYAGGKPAALYASTDGGATWAPVRGLNEHPSREGWQPGGAGLVLHSILAAPGDPSRLWVGISASGVFASEDGGATWDRRNRLSNEGRSHAPHPGAGHGHEVGHCVHGLVRAASGDGDLLYQQNHHGVFRSPDGGRSWHDITAGLPSPFGFPVVAHPHDAGTLWVLPLRDDIEGRFPPEAQAAVWRSRDGGESWQPLRTGLPERCWFTVLRQAMAADRGAPAGIYFGTSSGSVFASTDEGEAWEEIARHLPAITSIEVMHRP